MEITISQPVPIEARECEKHGMSQHLLTANGSFCLSCLSESAVEITPGNYNFKVELKSTIKYPKGISVGAEELLEPGKVYFMGEPKYVGEFTPHPGLMLTENEDESDKNVL